MSVSAAPLAVNTAGIQDTPNIKHTTKNNIDSYHRCIIRAIMVMKLITKKQRIIITFTAKLQETK